MGYVPNLIPKDKKVLPDYFKNSPFSYARKNKLFTVLGYVGAIFFFLSALAFTQAPIVAVLFAVVGCILLPPGHYFLEKSLRFKLTKAIKAGVCVVLVLVSFPFIGRYEKAEAKIANEKVVQSKKEQDQKRLAERKEQARKDSFNVRLAFIKKLSDGNKLDEALSAIDSTLPIAQLSEETTALETEKARITRTKAHILTKKGDYKKALPLLSELFARNAMDGEVTFDRAVCYYKTGKILEAVGDLKRSMEFGNDEAKKLHEKINPIRKRVVGYTTLCCDGTTSSATGRGACSWHGGVCEWDHPIYEEYRKYE